VPTALVTGASIGIGRRFATALAARGYDIVAVARNADQLKQLASELPTECEVLPADLTEEAELAEVEARLRRSDRPVDLLVNNAGFGNTGKFAELDLETEESQIRLNVLALVRLTHAGLPSMVERRTGGVINVSSIASFQPAPGNAVYGATKAFVTSFSLALREEVQREGVKVLVVCPGATRTEWQARAGYQESSIPQFAWQEPEQVVSASLKAFDRGAAMCTPGLPNKALAFGTQLIPRPIAGRLAGLVSKQI
jgi:uncharacterized protein